MIDHRQRVYDEYERFFEAVNPDPDWKDAACLVLTLLGVLVVYFWAAGA